MIKHKHISFFQTGIIAMLGMPFMLILFLDFNKKEKFNVVEINYPTKEMLEEMSNEKDSLRFNIYHPRGNFFRTELDITSFKYVYNKLSIVKLLELHYKFPNKNSYDGIYVSLSKNSTYSDYIFLQNQMQIHNIVIWFFNENEFYCYFEEKIDKIYPPIYEKEEPTNYVNCGTVNYNCGYKSFHNDLSFEEKFKQTIQPHITYWYYWLLYFITVFFSIKKLRYISRSSQI